MAIFGLESTDVAFLGLLFGVMSAIIGPITYFLINMAKNMSYLMHYAKDHEIRSNKEGDILDRVVTKLAVLDNRVRSLEHIIFKKGAPIGENENGV